MLEVGCGREGGLVPELAAAGYDVLGVDPAAPEGGRFVQARYEDVALEPADAAVAGRMLHHVHPLGPGLDRLAELAPLLLVDEFAWDLIGAPAQSWYEERHRRLAEAGAEPPGPPSLDDWRLRHSDLHPHRTLLEQLRARWREETLEWVPYLYRWLGDAKSESLERARAEAGAFPAVGWRWAGSRHGAAETG